MFRGGFLLSIAAVFSAAAIANAVPTVDPTLLNASTNVIGDGDDPPGLSTGFSVTSSVGDDPEGAFGNAGGPDVLVESTTFIFGNGRTVDNGNGIFGDGGESTDTIDWSTSSPVVLYGYRSEVGGDGNTAFRDTQLVRFSVEGEVDDLFDNDNLNGATDRLFSIPQVGNSLQYGVTHNDATGARIMEIDAITNSTAGAVVDPNIWNATTNGGGDQPAGLSFNIVASSVAEGTDTVEDAFGNNDGAVEPTSFIFGDDGSSDNGDNLLGTGGETIDFITWQTSSLLQVGGYQVTIQGDGGVNAPEGANRSAELMRFLVEGNVVSTIDLNAHTGTYLLLFDGGPVIGDDFRIEFTRANGSVRVMEIDAVNAAIVPEPCSIGLCALGLLAFVRFVRKRR